MNRVLDAQSAIYDQFQHSSAFLAISKQRDQYAAYYTSMYLIQDTGEAVARHMAGDFSTDFLRAYLEFWGVMQAINIQQDAISELHRVIVGSKPTTGPNSAWSRLRDKRNLCAGHPARRSHSVIAILACTRFRRHRVRCFYGTGGGSWRDEDLRGSSSLRLCG
jgi:hypothetical protein